MCGSMLIRINLKKMENNNPPISASVRKAQKKNVFSKGGGGSRPIQKFRGTFFVPPNCQKGGGGQKESKSFEAVLR